jgi:ElaB/YqjD/DUF883 family membrane-anchored ribosome-binding protein
VKGIGRRLGVGGTPAAQSAMEGFKQISQIDDGAQSAVDELLESVKGTVNETVERVKPAADLLDSVQQNPWLLVGSAIVMGYIFGSLAREHLSAY